MAKTIIPHKLIARLNPDGTVQSAILQYKIEEDGKTGRDFYTMAVGAGIKLGDLNSIMTDAKTHVAKGEKLI